MGSKHCQDHFPTVVIYRIYYKTMNNLDHIGAINKRLVGKTIYFQTDVNRGNVHIPRTLI